VPDANTNWTFREALTRIQLADKAVDRGSIRVLALSTTGYLRADYQCLDDPRAEARNADGRKRDIREGRIPPE